MVWVYIILGLFLIILIGDLLSGRIVVRTDIASDKKKDATVFYYLPESIIRIKTTAKVAVAYDSGNKIMIGSSNLIEESFAVTTEMIADTGKLLLLSYVPNMFMSDEIKYSVNSKGLLEALNLTTDDRTSNVISRISEAPQIILGSSPVPAGGTALKSILAPQTPATVKIKEFTSECVIKASDIKVNGKMAEWNLAIINELGVDEPSQTLTAGFCVKLSPCSDSRGEISKLIPHGSSLKAGGIKGILTRSIMNIGLTIEPEQKNVSNNSLSPLIIAIANISDVVVIPVKRRAFAKRVNKIVLQDGIVLSNEINSPSSVEGFISIPVDILKAIVSIPGQLIKFRYDNTTRLDALEKAKLSYEKSIQESNKYALTKEQEMEKVKLQIKNSEVTNKTDILNLQTTLLKAEKDQLDARMELEKVKKQLEKLKPKK